uniref:Uncharacterized protein n=1 Tax=Aegilops tauschii TaxID=37682 RepID=M8BK41_AEGTA
MQDARARVRAVVREALAAHPVRRLLQSSWERKRRGHAQDGGGSSCQSDRSCIQQQSFMISDLDNPDTFVHFLVSTPKSTLKLRSSAHSPKYGIGAFYAMPLHFGNSTCSEDSGVMGLRYDSKNLSLGASFVPSLCTAGNKSFPFEDLKNWDCGISYGVGSDSPLSPSLNFSLELLRSTQLVASFYEHQVVQRQVYSVIPTEATKITNYIDFGLELTTRVGKDEPTDDADNSSFQIAANWQANKNLLVKGKLGPSKSSVALAFKSWWKPSFTFSFTVYLWDAFLCAVLPSDNAYFCIIYGELDQKQQMLQMIIRKLLMTSSTPTLKPPATVRTARSGEGGDRRYCGRLVGRQTDELTGGWCCGCAYGRGGRDGATIRADKHHHGRGPCSLHGHGAGGAKRRIPTGAGRLGLHPLPRRQTPARGGASRCLHIIMSDVDVPEQEALLESYRFALEIHHD